MRWFARSFGFTVMLVGALLFGTLPAFAAGSTLTGTVRDNQTGEALRNVVVQLLSVPQQDILASVTTNSSGVFTITDIAAGEYYLTFASSIPYPNRGYADGWYSDETPLGIRSTDWPYDTIEFDGAETVTLAIRVPKLGRLSAAALAEIPDDIDPRLGFFWYLYAADGTEIGFNAYGQAFEDAVLWPGDYHLGVHFGEQRNVGANDLYLYFPEWYDDAPFYRTDQADPITVPEADLAGPYEIALDPFFDDMFDTVFTQDIFWMQLTGITAGCEATRYCPDDSVTRGQMAAFLVRALGLRDVDPGIQFDDIESSVFRSDILRLATAGITRGCDDTSFCPDAEVTRGQMAAFLVRAMGYDEASGAQEFVDADGTVFESDIAKLAAAGVTTGCEVDRFCPDEAVTRGAMAAFLHRALGGVLYPADAARPTVAAR